MSNENTKNEKIEYICEKAYGELLKDGINNFSLNKFIAELQMSKGQFYYYFKTKDELISKTIDKKSYEVFNYTYEQTKSKSTFLEKIFAFFAFFLDDLNPKFANWNKLLKSSFHLYIDTENKDIQQLNRNFNNKVLKNIENIFDEMINNTYLKEEARIFPRSLIATADGMYIHSLMDENYDLKIYLSEYLIMIDKLLKKENTGEKN